MGKTQIFLLCFCLVLAGSSVHVFGGCRDGIAEIYTSQLHVRELTGKNDGLDVEKYLKSAGLGKGYAWCGAFVNWVLLQCDKPVPKSAAWAPAWFPKSRLVERPQRGDVFGLYYSNLKRIGHVGFVDEYKDDGAVITVEGNTNGAGSREGNGVYRKRRLKRTIYKYANWID